MSYSLKKICAEFSLYMVLLGMERSRFFILMKGRGSFSVLLLFLNDEFELDTQYKLRHEAKN